MPWRVALLVAAAASFSVAGCGGGGGGGGSGGTSGPPTGGTGGTTGPSGPGTGSGGGGSGGGTASACDGMLPAFPAAVDLVFQPGTHSVCAFAAGSPGGDVALGFRDVGAIAMQLYSSSGTSLSGQTSAGNTGLDEVQDPSADVDVWFHWSDGGWQGIAHDFPPALAFETWDRSGNRVAKLLSIDAAASAPDGHGGSVVVGADASENGQQHLEWIDSRGTVQRDVLLDREGDRVVVSWSSGHVLVLSNATVTDPGMARWFGADGKPLTPWFQAHAGRAAMLRLLLDGRPVASDGTAWVAAYRDAETTVDAPPSWLASRPGTRLASLPSGRGYAILSGNGPDDFPLAGSVEIVTSDGQSCGTLHPPPGATPDGGTRSAFAYWVGQDGTLVEGSIFRDPAIAMGLECGFRWWPGMFRK